MESMTKKKFGVGIVGLQPGRSWAAVSHVPALRTLADEFEVVGVANSSKASSQAAAEACGIPHAFADLNEMVTSPAIDIVAVTVKVPAHWDLVRTALSAGKHVFCEWPLGRTLEEAEALANLAREKAIVAVTSTQSRVAPPMRVLADLINSGYVGEILSTSMMGWGRIWGATIDDLKTDGYLLQNANGATMLTIPFAHTLAAMRDVVGDVSEVSAILDTRFKEVQSTETGDLVPMDAPDQIVVTGRLANGAPFSMHYQGGEPRGVDGFVWDIHGTEGDIRVTGPTGHTQIVPLSITGAQGKSRTLEPIGVPDDGIGLDDNVPGNIARIYKRLASDLRTGSRTAPNFDDAVALHRTLAAIEEAARSGGRVAVNALNRRLPNL
jgi:predicted dehydrogenase